MRRTTFKRAITKDPGIYAGVFSYSAFMDLEMRSSSFKNSAVSSSSFDLEGGLRRGTAFDIVGPFVQNRAVRPSPPQLLHFYGERFFIGSEAVIILSNFDSASLLI
ncbi:hypothetical protein [Bradyrhizobium canariense]|uniref:Uncharacterized protein n=1 Tax=Bradyrhizobium canariense TaxID=255045 RepID=A0A1H2BM76_9BRAD|nr:hypothetical protein [Bradyrhizobium canariense]SDT59162.1 hypothetical protein SAMN05444158_7319 [Bradyrhizobium canariense]